MIILNDFSTSVEKALSEIDPKWKEYEGLIVCGTHAPHDVEMMIEKIKEAREDGKPFLGICFGMQLMVVEYLRSRGVLGATSEEIEPDSDRAVIVKMPKLRVGLKKTCTWLSTKDKETEQWSRESESYWHNYKVQRDIWKYLAKDFENYSSDGEILEAIKHKSLPYFRGVQFHPEYQSSKEKPHKILVEFLQACKTS